jgi:hypothetical protein
MKKLIHHLPMAALLMGSLFLSSCSKDEEPVAPVVQKNIPSGTIKVDYTVQVVAGNGAAGGRITGLESATVTVRQGGVELTKTTGADGMVMFTGLKPGTVSGFVSRDGFTRVNFTADINPNTTTITSDANLEFGASSTIYTYALSGRLSGAIIGNFNQNPGDNDANPARNDPGNYVEALTGGDTRAIQMRLLYSPSSKYPMGTGLGKLTNVSLDVSVYTKAASVDDGSFTFTNVPSNEDGFFNAHLTYVPVSAIRATVPTQYVTFNKIRSLAAGASFTAVSAAPVTVMTCSQLNCNNTGTWLATF